MQMIVEFFNEGGWFMYLVLFLFVLLMGFGIVHIAVARKWSMIVTVGLLLLTIGVGGLGTMMGRRAVDRALAFAEAEIKEQLREQGNQEASRSVQFGAICAGIGLIPLVIGEIRRRSS